MVRERKGIFLEYLIKQAGEEVSSFRRKKFLHLKLSGAYLWDGRVGRAMISGVVWAALVIRTAARCSVMEVCEDVAVRFVKLFGTVRCHALENVFVVVANELFKELFEWKWHASLPSCLPADVLVLVEHIGRALLVRQWGRRLGRRWRCPRWRSFALHFPPAMFRSSDFRCQPFRKFRKDVLQSWSQAQHDVLISSEMKN